jgi:glycine cleavage system transcriptional repressor
MEQLMVISAVGGEPTAVVQELTRVIMDCGGNIKESRIASFGSDVAMLLLVSGNWHTVSRMERELTRFANSNGVTMQFKRTEPRRFGKELLPYAVDVVGLKEVEDAGGVFGFLNADVVLTEQIALLLAEVSVADHEQCQAE